MLPVALDGSKRPVVEWDAFKHRQPTPDEVRKMFAGDVGIAIIGGAVSGGLEVLDFEVSAVFEEWADLIEHDLAPGLLARLPQVRTPNGNHVYFRSPAPMGNTVLARALQNVVGKNGNVVIETRGEGGYVIAPPSPAAVHASGRSYERIGEVKISQVPMLTEHERKILVDCARGFNAVPEKKERSSKSETDPNKPGTDYNARGNWDDILLPHGWKKIRTRGPATHWQRPGKADKGISATTGYCGDKIYVFSSNASPFEPGHAYSKFSAYGRLNHHGDFASAARELDRQGFGTRTMGRNLQPVRDALPLPAAQAQVAPQKSQLDVDLDRELSRPAIIPVSNEALTPEALRRMLWDNKSVAAMPHIVRELMQIRVDDPVAWVDFEEALRETKAIKHFKRAAKLEKPPSRSIKQPLAEAMQRGRDSGREIMITDDLEVMNDEALDALIKSGAEIYQRDGRLVHVVEATRGAPPTIQEIGEERLRELLASAAVWKRERVDADGDMTEQRVPPPKDSARAIMQRGFWRGVRRVSSVIEVPALRPDGTVVEAEGYDEATCVIYRPIGRVVLPPSPDLEDARMALDELHHCVVDFPFAEPTHRAAFVAAVLTAFSRHAFDGPAPLFLIDANTRGSGKTLLARTIGHISCGRIVSMMSPLEDPSEERKRITSIALSGDRLAIIDNATHLGGEAMNSALTNTRWSDRILGESRRVEADLVATWIATGNNTSLDGDMCRRVLQVRLRSEDERPEDRETFKHPDLIGWLGTEWPKLAAAALTMLRAYCLAGRPRIDGVKAWGSYEGWAALVPHAVAWVGGVNPIADRTSMVSSNDTDRDAMIAFLRALHDHTSGGRHAISAREMLQGVSRGGMTEKELGDAIRELCPTRTGDLPTAKVLGMKLNKIRDRVVDGMKLDGVKNRVQVMEWRVMSAQRDLPLGGEPANGVDHLAREAAPADPVDLPF